MTNVIFYENSGDIKGFSCTGHTDYANSGKDIVCASISSITQSTVMGLVNVLNINCDYKINEKDASLQCWLPEIKNKQKFSNAQTLLKTALLALKDLEKGFPTNIKVEVKTYVY